MSRPELEEVQLLPSTHGNDNDVFSVDKSTADAASHSVDADEGSEETSFASDPRFNPPPPSPWKRFALIAFIVLLFFYGLQLRTSPWGERKPKVVYASRYSKEHKFRPAASPVITEYLKDGRMRLRGALQTPAPVPTPTTAAVKKRRSRTRRSNRKATTKKSSAGAAGRR